MPTTILLPRQNPAPHLTPLPVLLEAQRIARSRGQILDIQALMSPAQREDYRASIGLPGKDRDEDEEDEKEEEIEKEKKAENGKEAEHVDGHEATATDTPAPTEPASATASPAPAARKPFKVPDLSHLHWKQRQKRLAQIAREQELLARGQITEMSIFTEDGVPQPKTRTKEKLLTNTEKEAIRGSASYWNNLLMQARRQRIPQWDYSTQQQHFERHSQDYYTHGLSPPPTPLHKKRKLSSTDAERALPNGSGIEHSLSNEGGASNTPGSASNHMQGSGRHPSATPTSSYTPLQRGTTPGSHPGQPSSARSNSLSLPPGFSGHTAPSGGMNPSLMAGMNPSQMGARPDGYSQGVNGLAMRGMGSLPHTGGAPHNPSNPPATPGSAQGVPSYLGLNNMGAMQGMQAAQAFQAQGRLPPSMSGMPGLNGMPGQGGGGQGAQGPMLSGGWRRD
ncbi:hypothetical protein B9479_002683 [Cryptococcus floricola]|uniref:Uncharacterized protein n=1 Tax=Cryptococcus floricola TaxID=2591691 RepID=A0A5D3B227_9TREE|nr:hypothetical protein B9479_002683 [Cryptococcus floricola]